MSHLKSHEKLQEEVKTITPTKAGEKNQDDEEFKTFDLIDTSPNVFNETSEFEQKARVRKSTKRKTFGSAEQEEESKSAFTTQRKMK